MPARLRPELKCPPQPFHTPFSRGHPLRLCHRYHYLTGEREIVRAVRLRTLVLYDSGRRERLQLFSVFLRTAWGRIAFSVPSHHLREALSLAWRISFKSMRAPTDECTVHQLPGSTITSRHCLPAQRAMQSFSLSTPLLWQFQKSHINLPYTCII